MAKARFFPGSKWISLLMDGSAPKKKSPFFMVFYQNKTALCLETIIYIIVSVIFNY